MEEDAFKEKVFRSYKTNEKGGAYRLKNLDTKNYSMEELFSMNSEDLEQKVFCIQRKYHASMSRNNFFGSPRQSQLFFENTFKYVYIKKQRFTGAMGIAVHDVL